MQAETDTIGYKRPREEDKGSDSDNSESSDRTNDLESDSEDVEIMATQQLSQDDDQHDSKRIKTEEEEEDGVDKPKVLSTESKQDKERKVDLKPTAKHPVVYPTGVKSAIDIAKFKSGMNNHPLFKHYTAAPRQESWKPNWYQATTARLSADTPPEQGDNALVLGLSVEMPKTQSNLSHYINISIGREKYMGWQSVYTPILLLSSSWFGGAGQVNYNKGGPRVPFVTFAFTDAPLVKNWKENLQISRVAGSLDAAPTESSPATDLDTYMIDSVLENAKCFRDGVLDQLVYLCKKLITEHSSEILNNLRLEYMVKIMDHCNYVRDARRLYSCSTWDEPPEDPASASAAIQKTIDDAVMFALLATIRIPVPSVNLIRNTDDNKDAVALSYFTSPFGPGNPDAGKPIVKTIEKKDFCMFTQTEIVTTETREYQPSAPWFMRVIVGEDGKIRACKNKDEEQSRESFYDVATLRAERPLTVRNPVDIYDDCEVPEPIKIKVSAKSKKTPEQILEEKYKAISTIDYDGATVYYSPLETVQIAEAQDKLKEGGYDAGIEMPNSLRKSDAAYANFIPKFLDAAKEAKAKKAAVVKSLPTAQLKQKFNQVAKLIKTTQEECPVIPRYLSGISGKGLKTVDLDKNKSLIQKDLESGIITEGALVKTRLSYGFTTGEDKKNNIQYLKIALKIEPEIEVVALAPNAQGSDTSETARPIDPKTNKEQTVFKHEPVDTLMFIDA